MTKVDKLMRELALESDGHVFDDSLVEGLPEPAQRYLLHAIRPGAKLAGSIEMRIRGRMRLSPKKGWMPFDSTETLGGGSGFAWRASVGGLMRFSGFDCYLNGQGEMNWKLWGVIPVASASGPEVSRSARGRFATELIFLPSALLPQRGVVWVDEGGDTACATLEIDGERLDVHLTVDTKGHLKRVDLNRWGNYGLPSGQWAPLPFTAVCSEEREFGGYSIPTRFTVGWWDGTERQFFFFEGEVLSAIYR